jgi:squalene-hopene/tetraprenyl-beta-curcumene cyclase
MNTAVRTAVAFIVAVMACASSPVLALDDASRSETRKIARETIDRAIAYLRSQQDGATGGWSHNPSGPNLPAISGLVLTGMLMDPRIDARDPAVARGVGYVLSFRQPDGGIYDGILPSYNTAINLSMLSRVRTPEAAEAIRGGVGLLRRAQWGAFDHSTTTMPEAPGWSEPVDESHPYYGGIGYGRNGRPDLSNTQFFLQALRDVGVSSDDPAVQRAMTFLQRVQMDDRVNPMPYAEGSRQGGFIYATVPNAESIDAFPGQSQAGETTETLADGTEAVRLRAYGSMTYAGFKSLIYADLAPDDPRVTAALGWIRENFDLRENPGLGDDGLYYMYLSLSRALDAWGEDELDLAAPAGEARSVRWADALIHTLAEAQREDGSFAVRSSRWMEDNPVLITAYGLIALQHALLD